ncbi:MAG: M1 family metallopeptidase [Halioglobus sp.]|nr:M1 family metallopeptidase [Halioglobus sp.]
MKRFVTFIALLVVLVTVSAAIWQQLRQWQTDSDTREAALATQGKLPAGVTPTHYTLSLRIDPDQSHFSGSVQIDVDILRQVDAIWLHGRDIRAQSALLEHSDGTVSTLDYKEMGHSGVVRLSGTGPISPQHARINIRFAAPFSRKLEGLYTVEDQGRNYAFTQFEPILARQAFPLFDEPRFKVPYDISLEVRQDHNAFGNTRIEKEEMIEGGFKRLALATTPPLPSYLLAFAVGPLDVVEHADIPPNAIRDYPIPLRGIAAQGKGRYLNYILEQSASLLTTLEEYFDIPYPYAKLDIVAVPDFTWGAMENAGLLTYRESLILLDANPSASQLRHLATVHAHELAHQWFGNLVTMPWWDDTWLNESFATWMASNAVRRWNPALEVDREILQRGQWAMEDDIYTDSRSVGEPVENNDDLVNAFDGNTYYKGSAVLQMLESIMTPEVFRRAIQQHLRKHAWGNATAEDLLQALAETADSQQVAEIARSYINQPGVPLVSLDWQCRDHELRIQVQQQRYLPVGSPVKADQTWTIPVCLTLVTAGHSTHICKTMNERQEHYTRTVEQCPDTIMPNHHGDGYYRWNLTGEKWQALIEHLDALSAAEKLSVANNLAAEYRAARIDTPFYLHAIAAIMAQPEWDVSTEPAVQIQQIWDTVANEEQQAQLADFVYRQYKPLLDELGLAPDKQADREKPVATQLLRERVLNLVAITLEQPALLAILAERGKALIGYGEDTGFNPEAIDRHLYATTMASAVINEGGSYFDALTETILASGDASFREDAIWALGQTSDPGLSERVLDLRWMIILRLNEALMLFESHTEKMKNRQRAFDWFKTYYAAIALAMPTAYLADSPSLPGALCSREAYADAQAFFSPRAPKVEGMQRALLQNLEKIHLCNALVEAQRTDSWTLP